MKLMNMLFGLVLALCSAVTFAGAIDINTASAKELEALDGIGSKKAAEIVKYREANGSFKSVNDLTKVPGVGDKTLLKNKEMLMVSGAATPAMPSTAGAASKVSDAAKMPATPKVPGADKMMPATPKVPSADKIPATPSAADVTSKVPSADKMMPTTPKVPSADKMPMTPKIPGTDKMPEVPATK